MVGVGVGVLCVIFLARSFLLSRRWVFLCFAFVVKTVGSVCCKSAASSSSSSS